MIIDTHIHIVPDIDDGSEDLLMSMEMLSKDYEQGVRGVFCTSHNWFDLESKEKYDKRFSELKAESAKRFPDLSLFYGSEVYFEYGNLEKTVQLIDGGIIPTMNGTEFVLMEFYPDVERIESIVIAEELLSSGYVPIIAHAERYRKLRIADISELVGMGCKVQINLYSLSAESDLRTKMNAEMLVRSKLVDFVGSDAHGTNHRPTKIEAGIKRLYEIADEAYIEKMCFKNASELCKTGTVSN